MPRILEPKSTEKACYQKKRQKSDASRQIRSVKKNSYNIKRHTPTKRIASVKAWVKKHHRETRDIPVGVRPLGDSI